MRERIEVRERERIRVRERERIRVRLISSPSTLISKPPCRPRQSERERETKTKRGEKEWMMRNERR